MSPDDSDDLPNLESDSQSSSQSSSQAPSDVKTLEEPPSDFDIDKALSTELMGLSLETRLAIEEEIHGVVCEREESPAFLDKKLEEFDRLLNAKKQDSEKTHLGLLLRNVIRTHGEARDANTNLSASNCYLNDPHTRLRFLRSESFDVPESINRLICFLEFTSELYGDFVADRPIALSDFSKEEEYFLRHSRSQYLPFRDRSGRRVQVGVGSINFNIPAHIRFKIIMFLQWVASEDVETQRKGIVIILWPFDEHTEAATMVAEKNEEDENERNWRKIRRGITNETTVYFEKYNNSIPVRVASIQQYLQDTPFFRAMSALYVFYGLRKRYWSLYRAHFGQDIELRYKLANYGIPEALMPMTTTGKVKTDVQSSWVSMLKVKEEQKKKRDQHLMSPLNNELPQPQLEIVECPSSNDVVFRKGRPLYKRNPGNMQYRELIAAASDQHSEAGRSGKYAITWKMVQQIEAKGGRFLEWTPLDHGSGGMWVVMTDRKAIREKIASALKQYNRDHFRNTNSSSSNNNTSKTRQENNTKSQKAAKQQILVTSIAPSSNQHDRHVAKGLSNSFATASQVISNYGATVSPKITTIPSDLRSDPRSYLFLPAGQLAYNGSTKRRKITLLCGNIATDCLPGNTANMPINNGIPDYNFQPNTSVHKQLQHSLQNPMIDFNMANDSSCFGKYFFPTG